MIKRECPCLSISLIEFSLMPLIDRYLARFAASFLYFSRLISCNKCKKSAIIVPILSKANCHDDVDSVLCAEAHRNPNHGLRVFLFRSLSVNIHVYRNPYLSERSCRSSQALCCQDSHHSLFSATGLNFSMDKLQPRRVMDCRAA